MRRSYKAPTCSYGDLPFPKKKLPDYQDFIDLSSLTGPHFGVYIMEDSAKSCSQRAMNKPTDANDDKSIL